MRAISPVTLGVLLFALANVGFALTDASAKWLIETAGILTFYMIAVRFLTGQASSMALGFALSGPKAWQTSALRLNLIRSAIMASTTLTNFWAVTYLDLTTTITIMFSAPFMVAVAAWYFLGERVGRHRFIAIAMGFIGVIVVIDPVGEAFHPAMLLSLGTAIAIAALSIITRFGTTTDSLGTQAFYTTLIGALIFLPFLFILDSPLPQTGFQWGLFLAVGIVFGTGGQPVQNIAPTPLTGQKPADQIAPQAKPNKGNEGHAEDQIGCILRHPRLPSLCGLDHKSRRLPSIQPRHRR